MIGCCALGHGHGWNLPRLCWSSNISILVLDDLDMFSWRTCGPEPTKTRPISISPWRYKRLKTITWNQKNHHILFLRPSECFGKTCILIQLPCSFLFQNGVEINEPFSVFFVCFFSWQKSSNPSANRLACFRSPDSSSESVSCLCPIITKPFTRSGRLRSRVGIEGLLGGWAPN